MIEELAWSLVVGIPVFAVVMELIYRLGRRIEDQRDASSWDVFIAGWAALLIIAGCVGVAGLIGHTIRGLWIR